jgi:hypothetical protein
MKRKYRGDGTRRIRKNDSSSIKYGILGSKPIQKTRKSLLNLLKK